MPAMTGQGWRNRPASSSARSWVLSPISARATSPNETAKASISWVAPGCRAGGDSVRRRQRCRWARRLAGVEPEPVRLVHPEMRARVPVVDAVLGHIAQPVADDNGLEYAGDGADRVDLVGPDAEHLVPDAGMIV